MSRPGYWPYFPSRRNRHTSLLSSFLSKPSPAVGCYFRRCISASGGVWAKIQHWQRPACVLLLLFLSFLSFLASSSLSVAFERGRRRRRLTARLLSPQPKGFRPDVGGNLAHTFCVFTTWAFFVVVVVVLRWGKKKEEENGLELRACQFFCVAFFQGRLWYRVTDPTW